MLEKIKNNFFLFLKIFFIIYSILITIYLLISEKRKKFFFDVKDFIKVEKEKTQNKNIIKLPKSKNLDETINSILETIN